MDAAGFRVLAQPCRLCACPAADKGVQRRTLCTEKLFRLWNAHEGHTKCNTCHRCILDFSRAVESPEPSSFPDEADSTNNIEEKNNNNQDEKLMQEETSDTSSSSASNQEQKSGQLVDYSSSSEDDSMDSYQKLVIDEDDDLSVYSSESSTNTTTSDLDLCWQAKSSRKKCIYCLKLYPNNDNLRQHIKLMHRGCFIKCEFSQRCPTYFTTKLEREKHYQNYHNNGEVLCPFCNKKYSKPGIHSHLKIFHSQQESFRCSYPRCLTFFKTEKEQQVHVKNIHENMDEKFRCLYCGKFYAVQMSRHVKMQHPEVAIKCNFGARCATFFKTKEERQQHVQKVHLGVHQEVTKKPDAVLGVSLSAENNNLEEAQSATGQQSAPQQKDAVFQSQNAAENDKEVRDVSQKIRVSICSTCPKAFLTKADMKEHWKQVHLIKRVCHLCQKSFDRKKKREIYCKKCEKRLRESRLRLRPLSKPL